MSANLDHFCLEIQPQDLSEDDRKRLAGHKAALLSAAKWQPGSTITIRFLDGALGLRERVKAVALEWTKLADLTFAFRDQGPTDIRIAFKPGNGSWSYLGAQCRNLPEPQPTMNYGWLTPSSPDDQLRRVVLHEFGHALGLIHEHQNPTGGIRWNRAAVIRDLSGPPNNWNEQTINNNMFKKYAPGMVSATPVDKNSIMMYPIPASWTEGGYFSADLNNELSTSDKKFIAENYPK
jgi:serralysin